MQVQSNLPLDYFAGSEGVSLTDEELRQAVAEWLQNHHDLVPELGQIERMAADDNIFVFVK
jgi:hypothetical protein